jgi:hypothetical protein
MSETPKTDAVMPMVVAMINRDIMPLIKKVLIKRAELYLREIEKYDAEGTPLPVPHNT